MASLQQISREFKMNLYNYHSKPESIHGHDRVDTEVPSIFWHKYVGSDNSQELKKREPALAKSPEYAVHYARYILKDRFPAGEDVIAKDPAWAYNYARFVIKGRWPKGEDAIAKSTPWAYAYAKDVLKGPWPKGEDAIAKNAMMAFNYHQRILDNKPFPKGEKAILNSSFADEYRLNLKMYAK